MRGCRCTYLPGLALLSGLLMAAPAPAQYNRTIPAAPTNLPSVHRGMYSAGPIGGIQQYNPAWQSDGEQRRDNGNFTYPPNYAPINRFTGELMYPPEMASKASFGSLATPRFGFGYGYGSNGGWWNGSGSNGVSGSVPKSGGNWNGGGWNGSGWNNNGRNVGYWNGGPWQYGNGPSGLPYATIFGTARYVPYYNQPSTVSIPAEVTNAATSSSAEASFFGW
ncbi:MAG: hypothetical protein U0800_12195 [Isosphaeraceae bacterium]